MNVLLTGQRQSGKTTVCKRVAELARGLGYSPVGVLALVVLDKDGFPAARQVLMVADGQQRLLARANGNLGGPCTGRYSFNADVFSWVIERLRGAISQGCDLLIVDEIGPLELEQGRGLAPLLSDLSVGMLPPLLLVVRPELAAQLQRRLPGIPFRTFAVTQENRQALPQAIIKELFAVFSLIVRWPSSGPNPVGNSARLGRLFFLPKPVGKKAKILRFWLLTNQVNSGILCVVIILTPKL